MFWNPSTLSMWYKVGKISSRITILLLIAFQSKLVCESYEPTKLWDLQLGQIFKKLAKSFCHFDVTLQLVTKYVIGKEVVTFLQVWTVLCLVSLIWTWNILISICANQIFFRFVKIDFIFKFSLIILVSYWSSQPMFIS
jgi:hypothetical protein